MGQRGYLKLKYQPEALTLGRRGPGVWEWALGQEAQSGQVGMQGVGRVPGEDTYRIQTSLSTQISLKVMFSKFPTGSYWIEALIMKDNDFMVKGERDKLTKYSDAIPDMDP